MTTKLKIPEAGAVDLIRKILNEKVWYKDFYARIIDDLIVQYNNYEKYKGCSSHILPLNLEHYTDSAEEAKERKKTLIGFYTPDKDKLPFSQLDELRRKNGLLHCPLCGELGRPRTLDHCLPKDVYPELSVHLLNLVPACDWCQGEKLSDYATSGGVRRYLHPYFDEIDQPLFKFLFKPPYSSPTLAVEILSNLDVGLRQMVESHIEGVNLLARFTEAFETSHNVVLAQAWDARQPGNVAIEDSLQLSLNLFQRRGYNCWDAVHYRSILEDTSFMEYLRNGVLPDFIQKS